MIHPSKDRAVCRVGVLVTRLRDESPGSIAGPRLSGGPVFSVWWGGAEAAVGSADEPPAAVMDGPVMRPTDQGEVVQVGGATIQPMPHMMAFTPGQGAAAAGDEDRQR